MKFSKEALQVLADCDPGQEYLGMKVVEHQIIGTSRWSNLYTQVFEVDDKFYRTSYSVAATESQCEEPYEYLGEEIDCKEVYPWSVLVTEYRDIPPE